MCVYMDDILKYSKTEDETFAISKLCSTYYVKISCLLKCLNAHSWQVEYLSHIVSAHGVAVDPAKVKAITERPMLQTKTEIHSFLGLANYYWCFIQNFSYITAPLSALVHYSASDCVKWTPSLNDAFTRIKQVLTQALVSRTYDPALKCILVTDASSSHEAIGTVLMQDDCQGPCPIQYYSLKMSPAETCYPTSE